jgi:hypothetical protein
MAGAQWRGAPNLDRQGNWADEALDCMSTRLGKTEYLQPLDMTGGAIF